jgi:hypothetical protein
MRITDLDDIDLKLVIRAAELGVLKSLPDMLDRRLKPGRLRSRFDEVRAIVQGQLVHIKKYYPNFFEKHKTSVTQYLAMLGDITGWEEKPTDIAEVVSFCVAILERSGTRHPEVLLKSLNDILDYYERDAKVGIDYRSLFNGDLQERKWARLKELEVW